MLGLDVYRDNVGNNTAILTDDGVPLHGVSDTKDEDVEGYIGWFDGGSPFAVELSQGECIRYRANRNPFLHYEGEALCALIPER